MTGTIALPFTARSRFDVSRAYTPINGLLPYRTYDAATGNYLNTDSHGFMLECSPLLGGSQESADLLAAFLNESVPAHTTVQFLHWTSPRIGDTLAHWAQIRGQRGGVFATLAQRRLAYLCEGTHTSRIPHQHYTLKHTRTFIVLARSGRASAMELASLQQLREGLSAVLKAMALSSRVLDPEGLIGLMDEWLLPQWGEVDPYVGSWNELDYLHTQVVPPGMKWRVDPERLVVNEEDAELSVLSVRQYPVEWAQWLGQELIGSLMKPQLSVPCPALTAFTLSFGDVDRDGLTATAKHLDLMRKMETGIARFMPSFSREFQEWGQAKERLDAGEKLVRMSYQVVLHSRFGEGETDRRQVAAIYRAQGWNLAHDRYVQCPLLLSCLPFLPANGYQDDLERLGKTRRAFSANGAHLAPLHGEWSGTPTPVLLLFGRRGEPLSFDPFDNQEGNYNMAIAGRAGSGKSVFLQEYETGLLGAGGRVFKLDVGRSAQHQCQILGGQFVEFSLSAPPCLNPFTRIDAADAEMVEESLLLVQKMCERMCSSGGRTSEIESALITRAVRSAWDKHHSAATYTAVQGELQLVEDSRARDLALMMTNFVAGGAYAPYFDGPCTLDFDNDYIVFELEELKNKPDLQSVVFMLLMYLVTTEMYYGDRIRRIALVIDEAWDLLRSGDDGEFIEGVARRARKYGGQLVTAVQGVNDYYASPAAQAGFENCDYMALLGQKKESIAQLKASGRIDMDASLEALLKSVHTVHGQYSEVLINGPRGYAVGRLLLDPFSDKLYSSQAAEFAQIEAFRAQGLSMEAAIERALAEDAEGGTGRG